MSKEGFELQGEIGAGNIPGAIKVDEVAHERDLPRAIKEFLTHNPHIIEGIRNKGQDAIARVSSHGKEIIVGVGIASGFALGGVVIYKHLKGKK